MTDKTVALACVESIYRSLTTQFGTPDEALIKEYSRKVVEHEWSHMGEATSVGLGEYKMGIQLYRPSKTDKILFNAFVVPKTKPAKNEAEIGYERSVKRMLDVSDQKKTLDVRFGDGDIREKYFEVFGEQFDYLAWKNEQSLLSNYQFICVLKAPMDKSNYGVAGDKVMINDLIANLHESGLKCHASRFDDLQFNKEHINTLVRDFGVRRLLLGLAIDFRMVDNRQMEKFCIDLFGMCGGNQKDGEGNPAGASLRNKTTVSSSDLEKIKGQLENVTNLALKSVMEVIIRNSEENVI